MEQYPLPRALKPQRLAVKAAVVIREKVQKAKFWTAGDFMQFHFTRETCFFSAFAYKDFE